LANAAQRVDLRALGIELESEPYAVTSRDLADLLDAVRGARDGALAAVDGAHHGGAAAALCPAARLVEGGEQPRPLPAFRPQPAQRDADARDAEPASLDEVEHRVRRLSRVGGALEIQPAELDALPARGLDDVEHAAERSRVECPGVERKRVVHELSEGRRR